MRWVFANFVSAICLALVVRTWIALGVISPVFVSGDSMAPELLGRHVSAVCRNCGKTSSVGAAYLPNAQRMPCPWCNAGELNLALPTQHGDRLVIDRTAFLWRTPQRGEPVVFHCPDGNRLCVKRVAGLPGETIAIRDGDLFIGGKRLVKSLAEQRRLRQAIPTQRQNPAANQPITDALPYNSGLSRQLNLVDDFFLSVRVSAKGDGALIVSGTTAGRAWQVQLTPHNGKLSMHGAAQDDVTATLSPTLRRSFSQGGALLEISTFDRQLLVGINRTTVLKSRFAESNVGPTAIASKPPKLVAVDLEADLEELKLYRDLYYTNDVVGLPHSSRKGWQLAENQWLLLGDNSPVSIDSRVWSPIPERLFIGKPLGMQ